MVLADWQIRSSAEVNASGADVSGPDFDTAGWMPARVPATVLAALVAHGVYDDPYVGMNLKRIPPEAFRTPWWHRTEFVLSREQVGGTVLLEFDGINYAANLWLNGRPLDTADKVKGAYRRFQYNVSDVVAAGENVLAVEVIPPGPGDFSTGFADWNPAPPDRNMGLFRPVRLCFCGPVSIERPFVRTRLNLETLTEADLTISVDLVNHSDKPISGVLEGSTEGVQVRQEVHLQPREGKVVVLTADEHASLRPANPRIWWPHDLGRPELYELRLRFIIGSQPSDIASTRFGIREVTDYWTAEGHRGFKVNGREVLIKGAGWTDDLLLADTPETIEAELRYVRHMNLNCIRCEGIWGKDRTLYDLCDEYGILMMVGWNCHWEHEHYLGKPVDERYGGATSPEDIELVSRSWQDQLLWLRNHPSIFVWAVASDKVPAPPLERRYIEIFRKHDPTRPYLISTGGVGSEQRIVSREEVVSDISGSSGVKMLGPYAYTPPVYWYTDTRRGGAYGFNTETSPGAVVPTLETLRRMIPQDHLWPIDEYWHFHCGLNEFNTLDRYREAIRRRYGEAAGLEDFARKAQVLNYELMRPMFEAFRVNRGRATGVIQWMLNAAWPKLYWQLYDWYLLPTGAFYGARKACAPLQLIYHYGDESAYLVTDLLPGAEGLRADIRVYDIESKLFLAAHFRIGSMDRAAQQIFRLPPLRDISTTYFLSLQLADNSNRVITDNFYWLSTVSDVLDYEARVQPWEYHTPSRQYADLQMLSTLRPADVDVKCHVKTENPHGALAVELTNHSDGIAFFIELLLTDENTKEPVVPIFWEDNYISLLPNETRTVTARFPPAEGPVLTVRGWNIEPRQLRLVTG